MFQHSVLILHDDVVHTYDHLKRFGIDEIGFVGFDFLNILRVSVHGLERLQIRNPKLSSSIELEDRQSSIHPDKIAQLWCGVVLNMAYNVRKYHRSYVELPCIK